MFQHSDIFQDVISPHAYIIWLFHVWSWQPTVLTALLCPVPLSGTTNLTVDPSAAEWRRRRQPESSGTAAAEKQTARRRASRNYRPLPPPPLSRHAVKRVKIRACKAPAITKLNCNLLQPTLQCIVWLSAHEKNDNIGRPYLLHFNCQQKLCQKYTFLIITTQRDTTQSAVLPRQVPSFQLGTVTLAGCPSVYAIIDQRLVFPTRWFSAAAALRRVTLPHLLASYKGGLLYVLTVYPAESWAPRVRAKELSVRPSVCL